jgi:hypothetical protein
MNIKDMNFPNRPKKLPVSYIGITAAVKDNTAHIFIVEYEAPYKIKKCFVNHIVDYEVQRFKETLGITERLQVAIVRI